MTVSYTHLDVYKRQALFLAGIGLIEFMVLLVWIAEYPRRPLFFGIQAWVFGAILLALQVLQLLAARGWANICLLYTSRCV